MMMREWPSLPEDVKLLNAKYSVTHDINTYAREFSNHLKKINNYVLQWKMWANPDCSKKPLKKSYWVYYSTAHSSPLVFINGNWR